LAPKDIRNSAIRSQKFHNSRRRRDGTNEEQFENIGMDWESDFEELLPKAEASTKIVNYIFAISRKIFATAA
jgi:hypothetical protein